MWWLHPSRLISMAQLACKRITWAFTASNYMFKRNADKSLMSKLCTKLCVKWIICNRCTWGVHSRKILPNLFINILFLAIDMSILSNVNTNCLSNFTFSCVENEKFAACQKSDLVSQFSNNYHRLEVRGSAFKGTLLLKMRKLKQEICCKWSIIVLRTCLKY